MKKREKGKTLTLKNEPLFRQINKYCKLFAIRHANGRISTKIYFDFTTIAIRYGFKKEADNQYLKYNKDISSNYLLHYPIKKCAFVVKPCRNYQNALHEIGELERSFGVSKWINQFMTPYLEVSHSYTDVCSWIYRKHMAVLRDAIIYEDWHKVGQVMGSLPSFGRSVIGMNKEHGCRVYRANRRTSIMTNPYAASLFRVGLQRFFHHNIPIDFVAKSAMELMVALIQLEQKQSGSGRKAVNNSLLYLGELFIFCIANGLEDECEDLVDIMSKLPVVTSNSEYTQVLRNYRTLYRYEKWRLLGTNEIPDDSLKISKELVFAVTEGNGYEATVFIDAMIHFLKFVNQHEVIVNSLEALCKKTPEMIGYCFRKLKENDMHREADHLIDMVFSLELIPNSSDSVLLDWVEQRVLNPNNFDFPEEMMYKICKYLFDFLDYGENRSKERAWAFLWGAIHHIEDPQFVAKLWNVRKSWWPKFHNCLISKSGSKYRKRVLAYLVALN